MGLDPRDLPVPVVDFLTERHLGTLTTLRPDGSPHVVAIAFAYDDEHHVVTMITSSSSRKVANIASATAPRAAVCQVDGPRWLTLEGPVRISGETAQIRAAEQAHARRHRTPAPNPNRVAIIIAVDRVLGRG